MLNLDYRNVEQDPARCGGQPVVGGTRIRVATVLTCYRQGLGVEEIVQQYPGLKQADVHDALAYAYDRNRSHPELERFRNDEYKPEAPASEST